MIKWSGPFEKIFFDPDFNVLLEGLIEKYFSVKD